MQNLKFQTFLNENHMWKKLFRRFPYIILLSVHNVFYPTPSTHTASCDVLVCPMAKMVAVMEDNMVADMEVDMVADMVANMVADMVAGMVAEFFWKILMCILVGE